MEPICLCIPRWRMMMNTTVMERWRDSIIRAAATTITKAFSCLMRTTLLIIHSITGSLAPYFKGWYCCSGYLGIYWSSSLCFGLDQCTQLPTVRHLVYIYIRNLHLWIEYWSDFKHAIIAIAKRIINLIIVLINTCRIVLRIYWYKGYLVSLAAADCVVLIASVPNEILWVYTLWTMFLLI